MSLKEKIENNIALWTLSTLLAGFLAGIATYEGVLKIGKLKVISISEYNSLNQNNRPNVNHSTQQIALNRLVSEKLEWALKETGGKSGTTLDENDEIQYNRLKKAVFQEMLSFQANTNILQSALETLANRGFRNVLIHKARLLGELPRLKTERLRWLEDKAIPELRKDIELLQSRPMIQRGPRASIPLPRIIWVLEHENGQEPEETVTDMSLLEEEVSVLKASI